MTETATSVITGEKFHLDMESTLQSMATAGIAPQLYEALALPENTELTKLSVAQKTTKVLADATLDASINTVVYKSNFADSFVSSVQSSAVDIGFSYVGEI